MVQIAFLRQPFLRQIKPVALAAHVGAKAH